MTDEKFNQILMQTLSPVNPSSAVNQRLIKRVEDQMDNRKKFKTNRMVLVAICVILLITGCAAKGMLHKMISRTRERYTEYEQIRLAEEWLGHEIQVREKFENGYFFDSIETIEAEGFGEEDDLLLNFKQLVVTYRAGNDTMSLWIREEGVLPGDDKDIEIDVLGTKQIAGKEVTYSAATYKYVTEGYELTEQDKERMEKENYYILNDPRRVGTNSYSAVAWRQDGLIYRLRREDRNISAEELFAMAEELIVAESKQ